MSAISKADLISLIRKYRRAYEDGNPLVSDEEYDAILKTYEDKYGDYDDRGLLPKGTTVKLPYHMGSMKKIKAPDVDKKINKWMKKYKGPYLMMDKVNGASILYIDGKLYTKGNHDRGKNVTHLLKYLNLPEIDDDEIIRGELVIPEKAFDDYVENQKDSKNKLTSALSMILGIVNNLKRNTIDLLKESKFVAYRYKKGDMEMPPKTQLKMLKRLGFEIPNYKTVDELDVEILDRTLDRFKKKAPYDIDGIVVIDNNAHEYPNDKDPEFMIGYKRDTCYITKVTEVNWKSQASGRMVPVIKIEPIIASGATITYVTGYNALYIENNQIGPGAVVSVCRSGEIIPKINHVILPGEVVYPSEDVEWKGPELMLISPEDDKGYQISKMVRFVKDLEINNIGEDRIRALYNIGVKSIDDLMEIMPEDMVKANLFSTKLANALYTELHQAINDATPDVIMSASYIFGKGFHSKRFRTILKQIPDIITPSDEELRSELVTIPGIGKKIMEAFIAKRKEFIEWIEEYPEFYHKFIIEEEESKEADFKQPDFLQNVNNIVFSGFRDAKLTKFLQELNIEVKSGVNKKTDLVVVADNAKPSSKINKAQDLGIEIMEKSKFLRMLNM